DSVRSMGSNVRSLHNTNQLDSKKISLLIQDSIVPSTLLAVLPKTMVVETLYKTNGAPGHLSKLDCWLKNLVVLSLLLLRAS
ncbi:hypothetical protein PSTG_18600, partial [Puccinia striiformis f. sp. tritici PST-78]